MATRKFSPEIINAAIEGFEGQKRRIDEQIRELRTMLSGSKSALARPASTPVAGNRKFSVATRNKMAMAQKARWAKLRGEAEPLAITAPKKQKRQLSEEGRKRIIAATKKRWRLQRAAKRVKETEGAGRQPTKPRRALPTPVVQE